MQSTKVRGNIPLTTYLLLTFGSAWLIWSPLLVVGFKVLRIPKESREQTIQIRGSSI